MRNETAAPTTVSHSRGAHVLLWTGLPGIGALLGYTLAHVPGWIAALPWFPNQQKITELAGVIGLKTTVVLVIVGILAGGFLAVVAHDYLYTVTIEDGSVTLQRNNQVVFHGDTVSGAFVDAQHLVLLGPHGEELAREKTELKPHRLRAGFEAHGYDWHERDPYGEKFTRWIDGSSGLSQDAHAILRARQTAIENDDTDDLRELRQELSRHGVFVREEGKRQYWRTAP